MYRFEGSSVDYNLPDPNTCYIFPDKDKEAFSDKSSSVNTGGRCVVLYTLAQCEGASHRVYPGGPHAHHKLNAGIDNNIRTFSTCLKEQDSKQVKQVAR
jgi:hypothetical protein